MELIGDIFIGICIIIGSVIIAVSLDEQRRENVLSEVKNGIKKPFSKPKMAEIIKRSEPVDEFLEQAQKNDN